MKQGLWWVLACFAIQGGWITPRPAAAQQPMATPQPMAAPQPMTAQEPVAGLEPLFPQAPLATQTQGPAPAPKKWGGQFFFSAGGAFFPGTSSSGNSGYSGFSLGFGADLPIAKDPLFGNTLLGELALNFGQFSYSSYGYQYTFNELALIAAPKYRVELGKLRPWIIPVGMAFFLSNGVNVGIPFGVGLDYMLTQTWSVGLDWRYNLNLSPSSINFGDFMTYGAYLGFNF